MELSTERAQPEHHSMSWLSITLLTAAFYWLFALAADFLSLPGAITAIWPASGIAAFSILVFGYRALGGIVLGVYLNQLSWIIRAGDWQLNASLWPQFLEQSQIGLSYAVGNALEAALILYLVRRFCGLGNPLSGSANVIRFIALAALASPIVGSVCGVLVTCGIWGWTPWADFWSTLWTWWVSAAAGILVVTPPLIFVYYKMINNKRQWLRQAFTQRWPEIALLVFTSSAVITLAFYLSFPFEYLLLPILLWSAFRFGQSMTSWLGAVMMFAVIILTTHGYGPFSTDTFRLSSAIESLTLLQCFVATLIGTAMIVSAILTERRSMAVQLRRTNTTLEERVKERTYDLSVARSTAEAANSAKSRFIAAASHDLRQPLYTLRLFTDALLMEVQDNQPATINNQQTLDIAAISQPTTAYSPSQSESDIKRAHNGVAGSTHINTQKLNSISSRLSSTLSNLQEMFENILERASQDAESIDAQSTWIDLAGLLSTIEQDIAPRVYDQDLSWHCHCPPVEVRSDPVLLERILRNLLDNAIKYTLRGTISVHCELVQEAGSALNIVIRDTGVGISSEQQRRLLSDSGVSQPEKKSHRSRQGLGLSIVQRLCQLLQHDLHVDSVEGEGTTITLTLKQINAQANSYESAQTQSDYLSSDTGGTLRDQCRVVIIDADVPQYHEIDELISHWGYEVRRTSQNDYHQQDVQSQWTPDLLIATSAAAVPSLPLLTMNTHKPIKSNPPVIVLDEIEVALDDSKDGLSTTNKKLLYLGDTLKPAQLRSAMRSCLRQH